MVHAHTKKESGRNEGKFSTCLYWLTFSSLTKSIYFKGRGGPILLTFKLQGLETSFHKLFR